MRGILPAMRTSVAYGLAFGLLAATLSGCGLVQREQRAPWRGEAELACVRQGLIVPTAFTRPLEAIDGPGVCGLERPFRIYAANGGETGVQPAAKLGCPLAAALNDWMKTVVQPAALARFGAPVAEIKNMASYGCRTRNNRRGGKLSEHAFGNGLDVGGFILTDGREVLVKADWRNGAPEAQAFLREIHAGACGIFTTVLGPGSDRFHEDHFHLDLARHNAKGSAYCRPRPPAPRPADERLPGAGPDEIPMTYAPTAPRWPLLTSPIERPDPTVTGSIRRPLNLLDGDPEDFGAHE
jgi:hypothetical protein